MKERKGPSIKEKNGPAARPESRDRRLLQGKVNGGGRNPKAKETNPSTSPEKPAGRKLATVVDVVDRSGDAGGSEEANSHGNSSDVEEVVNESDADTSNGSVSSLGEPQMAADEDEKPEIAAGGTGKLGKTKSSETSITERKASRETPKSGAQSGGKGISQSTAAKTHMKVHPKPVSAAESDHNAACSDDNVEVDKEENEMGEDELALAQKAEEMETRIKNLESELREVAALEIALYSVVPEHGSSVHKVHTPARRLSRLYIYACKYWSQDKRATVARNTVSGLVLVSKSCGNDVSRLTFWLSNTVVLREIISQAFGSSCQSSSLAKVFESSGGETKSSPFKWKNNDGSRQSNKQSFLQFVDDWQETRTFTAALERVESWLFSRIVESIWWQTLTPNMQSPVGNPTAKRGAERLLGPPLGNQNQGNFSIDLWKNAFHDALKRLCPVRAGGHECGCLPVLPRKVMEQCIGRLDVAMFNAILRESAHEIPTDPVSDPIVDSKVLPIPAGDLCFGSGAQLKNSVGSWARWLSSYLGIDADSYAEDEKKDDKSIEEPKSFPLLNSLSDLLMLPKDMLMDRTIRLEVCPLISLPLVKRILCNFSPDEFCPDPVPGAVLEAVNAECIIERRLSGVSGSFPFAASPIVYVPPSPYDVAEKVTEAGAGSQLSRSSSAVQRKGYTSDEELDELEDCLGSVVDKLPPSPSVVVSGTREGKVVYDGGNARYDLLREVWRAA